VELHEPYQPPWPYRSCFIELPYNICVVRENVGRDAISSYVGCGRSRDKDERIKTARKNTMADYTSKKERKTR